MHALQRRKISKILGGSKVILVGMFLGLLLSLGSLTAFAHGDEDHEEQASAPIINHGDIISKLAKTSKAEIFIKYTMPTLAEPSIIKIFLTDLITNASLDKIAIKLQVQNINPITTQSNIGVGTVEATPTSTPGVYEAKVTFSVAGTYKMGLTLKGAEIDAQALISDIVVPENKPLSISKTNSYSLLVIAIMVSAMTILIIFYLFSMSQSSRALEKMSKDMLL